MGQACGGLSCPATLTGKRTSNANRHRLDVRIRLEVFGHHNRSFGENQRLLHMPTAKKTWRETKAQRQKSPKKSSPSVVAKLPRATSATPAKSFSKTRKASKTSEKPSAGAGAGAPHPDRDQDLAVFTNFWYAAVRYQILQGWPNSELAACLGVSDHTWATWSASIGAYGVIAELVSLIDQLPSGFRSGNSERLRRSLMKRMHTLTVQEQPAVRSARKGADLPSAEAFATAVTRSTESVLVHLVRQLGVRSTRVGAPTKQSLILAEQIARDLLEAYRREELTEEADFEADLLRQLGRLAEPVARLSFLRANASFPGTHHVDPGYEDEAAQLLTVIGQTQADAKKSVRAYVGKVFRRIEAMDRLSESTAFLAIHHAIPTGAAADPMAAANIKAEKERHERRLDDLVDHVASPYSPRPAPEKAKG